METNSTSVLVVGGSLVGLSAGMFLAWQGVPVIVVERHTGSSPHPRAIGYTPRTMEIFRAVGLAERIPQVPAGFRLRRAQVESLAGKWHEETQWTPQQGEASKPQTPAIDYSPCTGASIAQDTLEPMLREKAVELGADIRFATELVGFEQDADGVTAFLRERSGREYTLHAAYLIAADGNGSSVRDQLGIGCTGRGHLQTMRSVLFRAPLDAYLETGVHQFEITQPGLEAFLTTYNDGRWVLMFKDDVERDETALKEAVCKAIGRSDLPIELVTTGRWELSAQIAARFATNRIFLAGDAAHTLPPTRGGFGVNTGIQDAHNLAWKLAAVLSGASMPQLLDTYDAERRPVAWLRYQQTFAWPDYAAYAPEDAKNVPILEDAAMELGQLYRPTAVLNAGEELPAALRPDQWAGQPGTRAPHLWVTKENKRLSTLDLFGQTWVLLAEDERWCSAVKQAAERLGVGLEFLHIGDDVQPDDKEAFRTAFGLGAAGASLIRPDGYVAWRATDLPSDPVLVLAGVFAQVSSAVCRVPIAGSPHETDCRAL